MSNQVLWVEFDVDANACANGSFADGAGLVEMERRLAQVREGHRYVVIVVLPTGACTTVFNRLGSHK